MSVVVVVVGGGYVCVCVPANLESERRLRHYLALNMTVSYFSVDATFFVINSFFFSHLFSA